MTSLPAVPPRCLNEFRVRRMASADVALALPDEFATFALGCICGHDTWRVLGNWFEDTTEFVGPLFAECCHCGTRFRIINTETDGFNGEIGNGIVEEGSPNVMWVCDECGAAEGLLLASFGYQFEPDAGIAQRQQDYFDAFILTHVCEGSQRTVQVTVFDCA